MFVRDRRGGEFGPATTTDRERFSDSQFRKFER